jgi:hypothetical protein
VSDERKSAVLEPVYATALGEALYCFALCEWNAVYCIQKHEQGYVAHAFRPTQVTMSGTVAEKLRSVSSKLVESAEKLEWQLASQLFSDLVKMERNQLIHGKPGTNAVEDQRLFYFGFEWTIERVRETADRFADCGRTLNRLLINLDMIS